MTNRMRILLVILSVIIALTLCKIIWTFCFVCHIGSFESEKKDILQRRNFLLQKINTTPAELINAMPAAVGSQFQGEWALYSLSMLTQALANISQLYPETQEENCHYVDSLINIALAPEIRYYDTMRWQEDPLETLDGNNSHISYISHLAWMISNYKQIGGDSKYDNLYSSLCETMNRRILNSPILNLPTYPNEPIYIPDMLVAIVALNNYARQNNGQYQSTIDEWIQRAQNEWIDRQTSLLKSFLSENKMSDIENHISGSYVALNCYYLTFIDEDFACSQYDLMKKYFVQKGLFAGIKEYHDRRCWLGFNMDAGIILFNLAPSATAFGIGSITYFNDTQLRKQFLRTAELAGSTIVFQDKRHYWLADVAFVGEAITLAMRTTINQ